MSNHHTLLSRSHPSLSPGRVVAERYEVLGVLGQGSAGTVYRARDLHVDSQHEIVALKAIHPQLRNDRQAYGRFKREADIMKRLQGPHLCPLLECVEDDGILMLAMPYVPGVSLEERLRKAPPLRDEELVVIIEQTCEALMAAHAVGVVHRDLKPANIIIEGALHTPPQAAGGLFVTVVDFGLAKMIHGEASGTVLTEQDMVFGTPHYMAPEQVAGDELDGRCDVYAAAAIAYEMVVGVPVFDTPGPLTTMAAHLDQPAPRPSQRAPQRGITKAVDEVLLRALAKDKNARYENARAFAQALRRAFEQLPAAPPQPDHQAMIVPTQQDTPMDVAQQISTTLASDLRGSTGPVGRGAQVRVAVREARPASQRPSQRPSVSSSPFAEDVRERRLWWAAALAALLMAAAVGIALGSR